MPAKFTNNATATLAASLTTSSTSVTVTTGQGALFPTLAVAGDYFYATLTNSSNNIEIVKITARSGDVLTATRAQDNTTARTWNAADKLELRATAASLANFAQLDSANTFGSAITYGGVTLSNSVTGTGSMVLSASPALTGAPTAPTATAGANSTQLATTAYVDSLLTSGLAVAKGGLGNTTGILTNVTVDGTNKVGYLTVPQNSQAAPYTLVLTDSGKHIYITTAGTVTIPSNSAVAFPIGTAVTFANFSAAASTIAITTDIMYLAGTGATGSRTLARYGVGTALKITATNWVISGSGVS